MFAIFCLDTSRYLNCPECKAAILCFRSRGDAETRAAIEYGFETYKEANEQGWAEIREFVPKGGAK